MAIGITSIEFYDEDKYRLESTGIEVGERSNYVLCRNIDSALLRTWWDEKPDYEAIKKEFR
ncbi:MAG: hypothetical protein Q7K28_00490 [Candidatus Wildermuthbacteria bacterium]|nr:hypothetical protein [Candidatus Wildermuthbacteria bacterium]